jgi:hypothetical protein
LDEGKGHPNRKDLLWDYAVPIALPEVDGIVVSYHARFSG